MTFDYRRRLLGYADRVRVRPGDAIDFKISLEDHETFEFRTVRIVCGVETPEGAPYREVAVDTPADGRHDGSYQRIDAGSQEGGGCGSNVDINRLPDDNGRTSPR